MFTMGLMADVRYASLLGKELIYIIKGSSNHDILRSTENNSYRGQDHDWNAFNLKRNRINKLNEKKRHGRNRKSIPGTHLLSKIFNYVYPFSRRPSIDIKSYTQELSQPVMLVLRKNKNSSWRINMMI